MPEETTTKIENDADMDTLLYGEEFSGVRKKVWDNLMRRRSERDKEYRYFGHNPQGNDRNLIQYINDAEERFHGYKVKPVWKEDWQANYFDPMTHDKAMAIIARVAAQPFRSEYHPRNAADIESMRRASVFENINDFNEDVLNDRSRDNFMRLFESCVKGTTIVFEDYENWEVEETEIKNIELEKGKIEWVGKKRLKGGLVSKVIPLEEFYPDNIFEYNMNKQLGCTWVQTMKKGEFKTKFKKFPNVEKVLEKSGADNLSTDELTFFREITNGEDDMVVVIRDFDVVENRFYIVANNVPLTKKDSPMRWKQGRIPFAKGVFEIISPFFFYGKSLPHKLENNQDAVNALFNMFLDRTMVSLFRPIITNGMNDIANDPISPNSIIDVIDSEGTREVNITEPGNTPLKAIANMKASADLSSVDPTTQGASVGIRTATEVERAQEGAREILSLFRKFLNWMERERGELRIYNIAQYYTRPVEIEKAVVGGVVTYRNAFNKFIMKDTLLTNGKRGTRVIEMVPTVKELPTQAETERENLFIKGESEIIRLTPDYIREGGEMDIQIVEAPAVTISDGLQRQLDEKFAVAAFNRPDIYNITEVAKRYAKAMYQPESVVNTRQQPMPMGEKMPGEALFKRMAQGQDVSGEIARPTERM